MKENLAMDVGDTRNTEEENVSICHGKHECACNNYIRDNLIFGFFFWEKIKIFGVHKS
jgi:hypothetical protein